MSKRERSSSEQDGPRPQTPSASFGPDAGADREGTRDSDWPDERAATQRIPRAQLATEPGRKQPATASPPSIALIEDDDSIRKLIAATLEAEGYSVRALATKAEGAAAIEQAPPDLALVDVTLPDGNGLDLIPAIRRISGRPIPVIVLSGHATEQAIVNAYATGASDYLVKPFRDADLLARCRVHLANARRAVPPGGVMTFGRYTIVRELARGGCGVVYLARDPARSGELVALKVPLPNADDVRTRARFIREAGVLATFRHPNIVAIRDVGMVGDRLFCAMEFVEGESLYQRVCRTGALEESDVLRLARGLLSPLAAIERAEVLHRDLKPSNVILRRGDIADPVLIDFGLARWQWDPGLTSHDFFIGTMGYTAPEVLRGGDPDNRSDLFSLALTLRFALAGKDILPDLSPPDLFLYLAMNKAPLPALPETLSKPFAALLTALSSADPTRRPPSAVVSLARLDEILEARTSPPSQ